MLDWITSTINSLGYLGIVLLMFLENIFPPMPSELIMPLAGFTATLGKLKLPYVILAGTVGSVLGALPWYYAGKYLGEDRLKKLADKYGKWLTLSSKDIEKSKQWFGKHGGIAVFFGRIVPAVRTLISLPAGLNNMHFGKFLLYTSAGSALWAALLTYAGYVLGQNYQLVEKFLGPVSKIVVVVLIVAFAIWVIRRRK
ncbi:DedA family protein [Microcoleus sp. FACHB-68]|uniref:DedA family protein n=1 Tax=Microcoleus sp. FACHB-68 TaxID=2692826 RepID=UPI0016890563|nr:DedA family protein [Microcoleus sp. FACHB-68]MBD1937266.1 DedA family protein [Microcoleus sp. FACHB-68]